MGNNSREYQTPYQRRYRAAKRKWAKDQFGNKCAHCRATEDLEFDHVDPATKSDSIANVIVYGTWEELKRELKKCQLLCGSCHRKKSIDSGDVVVAAHGTPGMYDYRYGNCKCDVCIIAKREAGRIRSSKYRARRTEGTTEWPVTGLENRGM